MHFIISTFSKRMIKISKGSVSTVSNRVLVTNRSKRKNVIWTFRRCQIPFNKYKLAGKFENIFPLVFLKEFCSQFDLKFLKISRQNIIKFLKKPIFSQRKFGNMQKLIRRLSVAQQNGPSKMPGKRSLSRPAPTIILLLFGESRAWAPVVWSFWISVIVHRSSGA